MSEEQTNADKKKQSSGNVIGRIQNIRDTLTGKNVEQMVVEHSELFTQVLLGLHGDMEALDKKVQNYASENEILRRQITSAQSTKFFALAALGIGLIATVISIIAMVVAQ